MSRPNKISEWKDNERRGLEDKAKKKRGAEKKIVDECSV